MKNIKNKKELLKYYMELPYSIRIVPEEAGGYFAEVEELPGCMTQGDTIEEVMKNIEEAKECWLTVSIDEGLEIPKPKEMEEYSGKFLVRIPKSLHRRLANLAEKEGISLNQMVVSLLSEKIAVKEIRYEKAAEKESNEWNIPRYPAAKSYFEESLKIKVSEKLPIYRAKKQRRTG